MYILTQSSTFNPNDICLTLGMVTFFLYTFTGMWLYLFYFKIKEKVTKPGVIFPLTMQIEKSFVSVLLIMLTLFMSFLTVITAVSICLKL